MTPHLLRTACCPGKMESTEVACSTPAVMELHCRFDTVWLGSKIRIAKDIRGDTLIVERDGPPRSFSKLGI